MFIFLIVWLLFDAVLGGNKKSMKAFLIIISIIWFIGLCTKGH